MNKMNINGQIRNLGSYLEVEVLVLSFGRRALMSDCREGAGGSRARVTLAARAKSPRMATNLRVAIFSYSNIYPAFLHRFFEWRRLGYFFLCLFTPWSQGMLRNSKTMWAVYTLMGFSRTCSRHNWAEGLLMTSKTFKRAFQGALTRTCSEIKFDSLLEIKVQ